MDRQRFNEFISLENPNMRMSGMLEQPHHTVLFRIDPTQNMRRFYSVSVQPNLFGGHSVMRNWERIGSGGQMRIKFYDSIDRAVLERDRLLIAKARRGYQMAGSDANIHGCLTSA